jgi:hypothetical protein
LDDYRDWLAAGKALDDLEKRREKLISGASGSRIASERIVMREWNQLVRMIEEIIDLHGTVDDQVRTKLLYHRRR